MATSSCLLQLEVKDAPLQKKITEISLNSLEDFFKRGKFLSLSLLRMNQLLQSLLREGSFHSGDECTDNYSYKNKRIL